LKSILISSFFKTGSFDVSTPQISTLFRVNPFPSSQELLYKKQYFLEKEKYAPAHITGEVHKCRKMQLNREIKGFF
jgi:hypothetical protein